MDAKVAPAAAESPSNMDVTIKARDMPKDNGEMEKYIISKAIDGIEKFNIERDIAEYIKRELEEKYKTSKEEVITTSWQVIVGRSFGSYVTHEQSRFLYFYVGNIAVLVFKA